MGLVLGWLLQLAGSGVVDKVLKTLENKSNNETERLRIQTTRDQNFANNSRDVVIAGMAHRVFWVAWSIAAIPTTFWYGWGMLDTAFNGALPDVASIPPGLLPWAQTVWNNIFYTGAAGMAAQAVSGIAGAVAQRARR